MSSVAIAIAALIAAAMILETVALWAACRRDAQAQQEIAAMRKELSEIARQRLDRRYRPWGAPIHGKRGEDANENANDKGADS